MSARTVYQCDGPNCEQQRKEVNHWFQMRCVPSFGADPATLFIFKWGSTSDGCKHLCGQECVQKMVEKWLATGKLD